MSLLIALIAAGSLRGGLSCSYITKVEHLIGLPVGVVFLRPTIEFGSPWMGMGVLAEDFYVSLDCVEEDSSIVIELGANAFRLGPSYRTDLHGLEIVGSAGFLRIDVAALVTGQVGTFSYAGQIDEERNGGFLGVKLEYEVADMIGINPFLCFGVVKDGNFSELGTALTFRPFKRRNVPNLLHRLGFTAGLSMARLGATLGSESASSMSESYDVKFVYYLVGLDYQLTLPGGSAERSENKEGYEGK